jgi:predicted dehydrogenase
MIASVAVWCLRSQREWRVGDVLRVGLVGTGFGTNVHLPAFARCDHVSVVGVCSAKLDRARKAADDFGVPFATDDYHELIDRPDVDLVDVCTPPDSHLAITSAALDAGRHVLCEKPLAMDSAQAQVLRDRAIDLAIVHAVNLEMRYTPVRRYMRKLVAGGFLGDVHLVSVTVHASHGTDPTKEPYYWGWLSERSKGGGFLMGSLSHHIDLLRFCFGELGEVTGHTATLLRERPVLTFEYRDGDPIGPDSLTVGMRPVDTDDTAVLSGTLANGGLVTMTGSWSLRHPAGVRVDAYGSEGTLHLEPDGRLLGARAADPNLQRMEPDDHLPAAPGAHYLVPHFIALAEDVAAAVDGRLAEADRVYATFDDGYHLQRVIDTIQTGGRSLPGDLA